MEVSVIGNSQATIVCGRSYREQPLSSSFLPTRLNNAVSFSHRSQTNNNHRWSNFGVRCSFNSVQSQPIRSPDSLPAPPKPVDGMRLFVGLPMDAVSGCNTVDQARAIAAGLKALKLMGVEGVEMPVWWGVAEKEAMGKYEWSSYLALAELIQNAGLKLHVSLNFHANKQIKVSLPSWVTQIGESQPDIFYTDRQGRHYRDCLSLGVDELPVLNGKSPVQVYEEFCKSFKSSFSGFMGSTITGITMGLGPDGELRYPSHHLAKNKKILGVGEFQCYDKHMLELLKHHAEATENPLWGNGGPHDAPHYDQFPDTNKFFLEQWGSWEAAYGEFFLSWYSSMLLSHGDRLLSIASATFSDTSVATYGKIPLLHSWYRTRAHAPELTAGFYNTSNRDGYEAAAEIFAKHSCKMILPGMNLSDKNQQQESSPEMLLAQIRATCRRHGVEVSGESSLVGKNSQGFEQIKKSTLGDNAVDSLTYQRMGADFFSPEHFPSFTEFVRSLNLPELASDDLQTTQNSQLAAVHE